MNNDPTNYKPFEKAVGHVKYCLDRLSGEVLERLNRPVSKTGVGVTPPWVRIPPSPLSIFVFSMDCSDIEESVPQIGPTKFFG